MDKILEVLKSLITADNIALLSVIVTVLIFIVSRSAEIRYKKRDDIKVQYIKLIQLMEKMFSSAFQRFAEELYGAEHTRSYHNGEFKNARSSMKGIHLKIYSYPTG